MNEEQKGFAEERTPSRSPSPSSDDANEGNGEERQEDTRETRLSAKERLWRQRFSELLAFRDLFNSVSPPQRWEHNRAMGTWVDTQRQRYRSGALTRIRKRRLDAIGFSWKGSGVRCTLSLVEGAQLTPTTFSEARRRGCEFVGPEGIEASREVDQNWPTTETGVGGAGQLRGEGGEEQRRKSTRTVKRTSQVEESRYAFDEDEEWEEYIGERHTQRPANGSGEPSGAKRQRVKAKASTGDEQQRSEKQSNGARRAPDEPPNTPVGMCPTRAPAGRRHSAADPPSLVSEQYFDVRATHSLPQRPKSTPVLDMYVFPASTPPPPSVILEVHT